MQIQSLRIKSYRSWRVADSASEAAIARMKKLELYEQLQSEGCSTVLCLRAIGWSKATYYRWLRRYRQPGWAGLESLRRRPGRTRERQWTKQQAQAVYHLRRRYPLWGKRKLWKILVRDQHLNVSESTVGRILSTLMAKGQIKPASFYYGHLKPRRRRQFTHHAKRWRYGMRAKVPGELIQIDPMRVGLPAGFSLKEFKAACPVTGLVVLRAYSRATSRNATPFLKSLITQLPFTLSSIQVDGGSEFRDEFEQACKDLSIKLYVLPPRKPEWNGCVERANGTSRYAFYPFYQGSLTVAAVNRALADYQWTYHYYRPHDSLALMTPMRYYQKLTAAA